MDTSAEKNDRIFLLTRIVSALVVPVLLLAFVILYFIPEETGQRFAWEIKPPMTAMYMGAGYLGGAYLFTHVVFGRRWHRVSAGFLPVTMFTISMLFATILHWDRFDLRHFPFLVWLGLYIATPFLVPWLWVRNQVQDIGIPETTDVVVPSLARLSLRSLGVLMLGFAIVGFAIPAITIRLWPWALTPLMARVLAGWFALLGVGGLVISTEARWSAWRTGLGSIALWHALVLVGAMIRRQDFNNGSLINWYLLSVLLVLIGMLVLYIAMELKLRERWHEPSL